MKIYSILISLLIFIGNTHAKLIEEITTIPVKVTDMFGRVHTANSFTLVVYDDAAPKPRPIGILLHGRAVSAQDRAEMDITKSLIGSARWLARNGFISVAFARIGYSQTGGEDIDDTGACRTKRYFEPYESAVNQTLQVLAAMRERPDVAQDRGIIIGQSYGGSTATGLAARNPSGIQAMINFAGGGGGNPDTSPRNPCRADLLKKLFADYGKTARVPMLFAYTENDLYWGAEHPKDWFGVFKSSGGVGQFIQFPPEGKDGHSLFYRAPQIWRPRVAEFLRVNGFPEIKP